MCNLIYRTPAPHILPHKFCYAWGFVLFGKHKGCKITTQLVIRIQVQTLFFLHPRSNLPQNSEGC